MDYELHVSDLETQKGKFTSLKSSAGDLVDACDSLKGKITGEISSLNKKVEDASKKISTGYDSYETWIEGYVTDLETTENTLASGIKAPALKGDFTNTFAKILIPALKSSATDEDKKKVQDLGDLGVSIINGYRVVDGNIIDTSRPLGKGEKYSLSDEELAVLAYVAKREQGSVEGAKIELSLMANLYEKYKSQYSSVTDYVLNSGWFASNSMAGYSYPGDEYYNAAKEVLSDGNRYLALNVVEHDCINPPDIISCSTGDVNDRSCYIPGKTVLKNRYGATYVFVGFAPNGGDPFGYLI